LADPDRVGHLHRTLLQFDQALPLSGSVRYSARLGRRQPIMPPAPRAGVVHSRKAPQLWRARRAAFLAVCGKLESSVMTGHQRTARLSASPRLFENRFLDFFSRIHPSVPAIIFVPAAVAGVWLAADRGYGVGRITLLVAAGVLIWTLTEYWLHRLVFHWEPDHPIGSRLHFIIHGVHHDHPNDRLRLVMPPAVSVPLAALFLWVYTLIFGTPAAYPIFSGFILGYPLSRPPSHPEDQAREEVARAAHAAPLPGPPLRLRCLLPTLGRDLPHRASKAARLDSRPHTAQRRVAAHVRHTMVGR
jgi:hypothetical protein